MDAKTLDQLLNDPAIQDLLEASSPDKSMLERIADVLDDPNRPVTAGEFLGQGLGRVLGLAVRDRQDFDCPLDPAPCTVAAMMAALEQEVEIDAVRSDGNGHLIRGRMPGGWAFLNGHLIVEIRSADHGSTIAAMTEIRNQRLAWGAGKRRLRRFQAAFETASAKVDTAVRWPGRSL
ncbi:hypothetical protein ACFOGJ_26145 [Marinibaculum pumilum]|uniref:Uncharacterized protein n=1 Tax=Marinibaculum pumilum TaxID=1766165 RepID=A0ABV7L7V7_9PROT